MSNGPSFSPDVLAAVQRAAMPDFDRWQRSSLSASRAQTASRLVFSSYSPTAPLTISATGSGTPRTWSAVTSSFGAAFRYRLPMQGMSVIALPPES
ncbi:hypothetical protein [Streptosporangium sp. NBC_01639]|uniref:hypothetical protein n=1 Tax=Streptosporangium sp. NBC_01639 TaxID=2975948 RepID=UPI0038651BB3